MQLGYDSFYKIEGFPVYDPTRHEKQRDYFYLRSYYLLPRFCVGTIIEFFAAGLRSELVSFNNGSKAVVVLTDRTKKRFIERVRDTFLRYLERFFLEMNFSIWIERLLYLGLFWSSEASYHLFKATSIDRLLKRSIETSEIRLESCMRKWPWNNTGLFEHSIRTIHPRDDSDLLYPTSPR